MNARLGMLLAFLCVFLASASAQVGISVDELKLFQLLNQERAKAGLPKFQWDYHLAEAARAHAQLLAERRALSHQFPGEPVLGERIGATGARFNAAAENVAEAPTVEELHSGLMNSPPHRANILNGKYNAVGLAIVSRNDQFYVAQNFAHVLPSYSEPQFRDALLAAFNKIRLASNLPPIPATPDAHLKDEACAGNSDAKKLIASLPGVTDLVVFTSSTPEKLPDNMKRAASDAMLRRMNIGVCFRPGKDQGYGSFFVVAAFYP